MSEPRWDHIAVSQKRRILWLTMLSERRRTVRDYWVGLSSRPSEGVGELRMDALIVNGRENQNPNRDEIVTFYEGVVRFLLHWINTYRNLFQERNAAFNELQQKFDRCGQYNTQYQDEIEELRKQLEAERWTTLKIYQAEHPTYD